MSLPNLIDAFLPKRLPNGLPDDQTPGLPGGFYPNGDQPPVATPVPGKAEYAIDATKDPTDQAAPNAAAFYPSSDQSQTQPPVMQSVPTGRPAVQPIDNTPQFYPNGVQKYAMDERLPSGETMVEAAGRATGDLNQRLMDYSNAPGQYAPGGPVDQQMKAYQDVTPPPAAAEASGDLVAPPPRVDPADPSQTAGWGTAFGKPQPPPFVELQNEKDPEKLLQRAAAGETVGKSKWWKRALKGALDGLATGGIGGAITGSAIEGFFPKSYQNIATHQAVAAALPRAEYLSHQRADAEKERKATEEEARLRAETEGIHLANDEKKITNAYSIVTKSPEWELAMKTEQITPELADALNARAGNGIHLTAADWQKKKVEFVNGKPWNITEQGVASRNTGLPIKPDEVPRTIDFGGGPMPLTPKEAAPIMAAQVQGDANRKQAAIKDNADKAFEAQKTNISNSIQYNAQLSTAIQNAVISEGAALTGNDQIKSYNDAMAAKGTQLTLLQNEPPSDKDTVNEARVKQINDLNDDMWKLQQKALEELSKSESGKARADAIRANFPTKPEKLTYTPYEPVQVRPAAPTSKGGKNENIGTLDAYQRALQKVKGH